MALDFEESVRSTFHLTLAIFEELTAELLEAFVDVFDREDHAWARREGVYFSASVPKFRDEILDEIQLRYHVEM